MEEQKTKIENLEKGNYLSRLSYMKIIEKNHFHTKVENEEGLKWNISNEIIEKECFTANQAEEEIKVTRTELIEIFSKCHNSVFTVNFNKQVKLKDVVAAATARDNGKIKSTKEISKLVREAEKGENRTLIGYLIKVETGFGRSVVIDLEKEKGDNPKWDARTCQVDHRTLNWLIFENKKYIVK